MPRYHLHIYNSIGVTRDEEGQELPDLADAEKVAIDGVRSILGSEVLAGRLDLRGRVEIATSSDEVLRVIAFPDIVRVLREDGDR